MKVKRRLTSFNNDNTDHGTASFFIFYFRSKVKVVLFHMRITLNVLRLRELASFSGTIPPYNDSMTYTGNTISEHIGD